MTNIDELKSTGLKATLPRLKILEIFQKGAQRHMTAEDVFRVLLQERSDIGLATVYRVLTQFEQAGLLKRHHFEGGKSIFELNEGDKHDHIVCVNTGKVVEFHDAEIEKRQNAVAKTKGFAIADHALSLYAHCNRTDCPSRTRGTHCAGGTRRTDCTRGTCGADGSGRTCTRNSCRTCRANGSIDTCTNRANRTRSCRSASSTSRCCSRLPPSAVRACASV